MSRKIRCSVCGLLHNKEEIRKTRDRKYICLDCIENSDGEYIECNECHIVERRSENGINITRVGDIDLCNACRDLLAYQCQDCREWTLKRNLRLIESKLICPNCANNFTHCDRCGREVHNASTVTVHTVNGDIRVCSNCLYNYHECNECNERFDETLLERVSPMGYVCVACAERENYSFCPSCNRMVRQDDMEYEDEDGDELEEPICSQCYNNQQTVIHNYHQDEHFIKRYAEEDSPNEPLLLGMEIEVGGSTSYAKGFLKHFRPENDVMLMHDGSVRGFEIVTNPMTYKYIQKHFYPRLKEGMKYLIEKGFKGHNEGGIHIHISEDAVTKYQVAQLSEILYGNRNDYETWLILTQRKRENTSWCRFERNTNFYKITDHPEEKPPVDSQRHTALNHDTRTGTYEFRIFNSSLRMDRIKKNVQCVIALLDYTADHKYDERPVCNLTKFLEYVMDRKIFYPELATFIEEKRLMEAHKNKNYRICNTETEREEVCA